MATDLTCLSYWFPLIRDAGLPVPETVIIKTDCQLGKLLYNEATDGSLELLTEIRAAARQIGFPVFLRTGHTSNKHYWKDTCFVAHETDIAQHVYDLVEFSEMCCLMGLPTNVWVVRKMLTTAPAFVAFEGMPIVREFRVFTRKFQPLCIHPYWPQSSIIKPTHTDWKKRLAEMSVISGAEAEWLRLMAVEAVLATEHGDWSVDFLQDAEGKWWLTDMAEADKAYHWPECKFA